MVAVVAILCFVFVGPWILWALCIPFIILNNAVAQRKRRGVTILTKEPHLP
jgi:hypothetical protein